MSSATIIGSVLGLLFTVAGVWGGQRLIEQHGPGLAWKALIMDPPTVFMPLRLWRTDAVVLCLAALLLLPPAAGRYRLGKFEGAGLIVLYVIYLLITLSPWR